MAGQRDPPSIRPHARPSLDAVGGSPASVSPYGPPASSFAPLAGKGPFQSGSPSGGGVMAAQLQGRETRSSLGRPVAKQRSSSMSLGGARVAMLGGGLEFDTPAEKEQAEQYFSDLLSYRWDLRSPGA